VSQEGSQGIAGQILARVRLGFFILGGAARLSVRGIEIYHVHAGLIAKHAMTEI
jgi:hypothetical protein